MRLILDPIDRWIGRPQRGRKIKGNKAPVAIDDTVSVLRDGGPVTLLVLANDIEPGGEPITLQSAFAALGTAVANGDGTVSYTPPNGPFDADTIVYEIADPGGQIDTGQVNITLADPSVQIIETNDSRLDVETTGGGVDVIVTAPNDLAGTYSLDTHQLAGGPVNLRQPAISGTFADGETLLIESGLWAHGVETPDASVVRRLVLNGFDGPEIEGESLFLAPGDTAGSVAIRETLADAQGQRTAESQTLGTPFQPADDPGLFGWWDASDIATLTATGNDVTGIAAKAGSVSLTSPLVNGRTPTTGQRTINGLNVLEFANDQVVGNIALPASGNVAFHLLCDIGAAANPFGALFSFDGVNDFQLSANDSPDFNGALALANVGSSFDLTGGPFSGLQIVSVIFDLSNEAMITVFVGGVAVGSTAYSNALSESGVLRLFTNRTKNAFVSGAFGELLLTETTGFRAHFHAYLSSKWGIS